MKIYEKKNCCHVFSTQSVVINRNLFVFLWQKCGVLVESVQKKALLLSIVKIMIKRNAIPPAVLRTKVLQYYNISPVWVQGCR